MQIEFFKNLELIKNKNYKTMRKQYLKSNNIIDLINPTFKKICYSTIRIHLTSHILLNSLNNLNNDISIYKNMTIEQKKELKTFKLKITKIFARTRKIMNDISSLI